MARRGRKKKFRLNWKFDINPDVTKSVLAIAFFILGGLGALSVIAPGYSLNGKVKSFLQYAFGDSFFLVPLTLILVGLLFVDAIRLKIKNLRILVGLLLLQISFATVLELFRYDGGFLGYEVSEIVIPAISKPGAIFVFILLIALSFILIFHVSINQVLSAGKKVWEKIKEKVTGVKIKKEEGDAEGTEDAAVVSSNVAEESMSIPSEFELVAPLSEPQIQAKREVPVQGDQNNLVSIAPGLPYSDRVWEMPPLDLLEDDSGVPPNLGNVKEREKIIKDTLKSFNVNVDIADVRPGPSVTQYALSIDTGTKISKIVNLQYELASALKSPTGSVRIEAPIPGKDQIGIEVPNVNRAIVRFKSLLTSDPMKNAKSKLTTVLGRDVGGSTIVYDIGKMPHMLIAGATGSGKSIFLHSLLFSLLYRNSPQDCKLILVDTKRTELVNYEDIPHLITPVVTEPDRAAAIFRWAVEEMDKRYKLLSAAKVRNIDSYNQRSGFQVMPYIVIVVDELADIMLADPSSVEKNITRLAQLSRAAGIHLVLSVQRPSTDVLTGLIKANIPCRVAFNVSGQVDSRVILDQPGAEKLLGKGDMLFSPVDAPKPMRLQGAMVSEREINNLVNYLRAKGGQPEFREDIEESFSAPKSSGSGMSINGEREDEKIEEAIEVVTSAGKASASLLQRRLAIGYARAARILDSLEEMGVVGPQQGSRPRDVLTRQESAEDFLGPDSEDSNI